MDTPNTDSSLDENTAAQAFAALLEEPKEPTAQAPQAQEQAAPEPEAQAEEPEQAEQPEEEQKVPVVIDGKTIEVPLKEVLASYQKDKASTERFMAAAETKKAAEAEIAKARQEREAYAQNLSRMQAVLEGSIAEQNKVDWEALIQSDPVEYLKQQHLAQQRQAQLSQVRQEQEKIAALTQSEQQKAYSEHLAQQAKELQDLLPEWKDEAKAKAEKTALRDYLLKAGYDEKQVNQVSNAKDVLLARKAMLYDQMVSKAQAAAKKVSALPTKVERPGTAEVQGLDRRSQAFQRLSKSGKVEDAAALFANLIS